MDIIVTPDYQRREIGSELMKHIEELALARGAILLRSDTGTENVGTQKLHEKRGFKAYRIRYEKILSDLKLTTG
ncbi:MAG: GNAT family N-acetyltransferase [Thermoplasmata archaeon]